MHIFSAKCLARRSALSRAVWAMLPSARWSAGMEVPRDSPCWSLTRLHHCLQPTWPPLSLLLRLAFHCSTAHVCVVFMCIVASRCLNLFLAVGCLLRARQARCLASEAERHAGPNQGWSDALVLWSECGTQRACRAWSSWVSRLTCWLASPCSTSP